MFILKTKYIRCSLIIPILELIFNRLLKNVEVYIYFFLAGTVYSYPFIKSVFYKCIKWNIKEYMYCYYENKQNISNLLFNWELCPDSRLMIKRHFSPTNLNPEGSQTNGAEKLINLLNVIADHDLLQQGMGTNDKNMSRFFLWI